MSSLGSLAGRPSMVIPAITFHPLKGMPSADPATLTPGIAPSRWYVRSQYAIRFARFVYSAGGRETRAASMPSVSKPSLIPDKAL